MITDKWLSRLFGVTICFLAVMTTVTLCWLVLRQLPIPDPLDRFLTFLVGALVGRLTGSKSPEQGDSPIPTTVENKVWNPVPTSTTEAAVPDSTAANLDELLPAT